MLASPLLDSHEPVLQFSHSLNRTLQGYDLQIESISQYYSHETSEYLNIVTDELKSMLSPSINSKVSRVIRYAIESMPGIVNLSSNLDYSHPAMESLIQTHISDIKEIAQAKSSRSGSITKVVGNVYYVNFASNG